jgi:hypothetical protein
MKIKCLLLSILVFTAVSSFSQSIDLRGRVTDDRGEDMSGVTVSVRGTTTATATDSVGQFILSVPAGTRSVVFHYIGYDEREVEVARCLSRQLIRLYRYCERRQSSGRTPQL